jgi:predicted HD superfamily hydrolase involved in NAD metabolism
LSFIAVAKAVRAELGQEARYAHVVRVARLADRLAARHGQDPAKARLAGMLHDLARLYPGSRLVEESERRGLRIDAFERAHPIVLHARLGAELARERFGVDDPDVLSAIALHTLAGPAMSPLAEIVFIADSTEPGRQYPSRASLEALAFRNLDAAMIGVIEASIDHLKTIAATVAPQTLAALAVYRERSPACPT